MWGKYRTIIMGRTLCMAISLNIEWALFVNNHLVMRWVDITCVYIYAQGHYTHYMDPIHFLFSVILGKDFPLYPVRTNKPEITIGIHCLIFCGKDLRLKFIL